MDNRFPQNKKEDIIFLVSISIVSVLLIVPIIFGFEKGFTVQNLIESLKTVPLVWITILVVVSIVEYFTKKLFIRFNVFAHKNKVAIIILTNVFIISFFMSLIGPAFETQTLSLSPLVYWPRNFLIALVVEYFIAHRVAHQIMLYMHKEQLV